MKYGIYSIHSRILTNIYLFQIVALLFCNVASSYQMPNIIRFLLGGVSALSTRKLGHYPAFPFQMFAKRALVFVTLGAFRAGDRS